MGGRRGVEVGSRGIERLSRTRRPPATPSTSPRPQRPWAAPCAHLPPSRARARAPDPSPHFGCSGCGTRQMMGVGARRDRTLAPRAARPECLRVSVRCSYPVRSRNTAHTGESRRRRRARAILARARVGVIRGWAVHMCLDTYCTVTCSMVHDMYELSCGPGCGLEYACSRHLQPVGFTSIA